MCAERPVGISAKPSGGIEDGDTGASVIPDPFARKFLLSSDEFSIMIELGDR